MRRELDEKVNFLLSVLNLMTFCGDVDTTEPYRRLCAILEGANLATGSNYELAYIDGEYAVVGMDLLHRKMRINGKAPMTLCPLG